MGLTATTLVPLTVAARNEARSIGATLASLLTAARYAEARLPICFGITVVLDRSTDGTAEIVAKFPEVAIARLSVGVHGKIEAQRRGRRPGPFNIFSDADIAVTEETLFAMCRVMLAEPAIQIAFPPKQPLPARRRSLLARALFAYNAARGYSSSRTWFSGKLFAIRTWEIPPRVELAARIRALPASRFYAFDEGLRADDIYLSRRCLQQHGRDGLHETRDGLVHFRAPETFEGMYRYYRRMRQELERMDALFPETKGIHARCGQRFEDRLAGAPMAERLLYQVFRGALYACRARYRWERFAVDLLARPAGDPWPPVEETKLL